MQGFESHELLLKFRYPILILTLGLILVCLGVLIIKNNGVSTGSKVEVLGEETDKLADKTITVEIAGEVIKPGVYSLSGGSRVDDAIAISGGFSVNADHLWTDKYLNRAAKVTDGQKIYIPAINQQSSNSSANNETGYQNISSPNLPDSSSLVNINTATLKELDSLPGIGQTYGQNIIEHRPYSTLEELVSKGAIKQSLFNKIKDSVTLY